MDAESYYLSRVENEPSEDDDCPKCDSPFCQHGYCACEICPVCDERGSRELVAA